MGVGKNKMLPFNDAQWLRSIGILDNWSIAPSNQLRSEWVSEWANEWAMRANERAVQANERASGPVLMPRFKEVLNNCARIIFPKNAYRSSIFLSSCHFLSLLSTWCYHRFLFISFPHNILLIQHSPSGESRNHKAKTVSKITNLEQASTPLNLRWFFFIFSSPFFIFWIKLWGKACLRFFSWPLRPCLRVKRLQNWGMET